MMETLKELRAYLGRRKALWLAPMIVILLAFGALLLLAQSSAVAPFIYTLF
ncbi:MAG: DUF5989 family protein [Elusimicrobiota bacterium]|nr:DUF5989 family protein [Elusimicrobiota bacterium]